MLTGKGSLNIILVVMFLLMSIFRVEKKIPFNPSLLNVFIVNEFFKCFITAIVIKQIVIKVVNWMAKLKVLIKLIFPYCQTMREVKGSSGSLPNVLFSPMEYYQEWVGQMDAEQKGAIVSEERLNKGSYLIMDYGLGVGKERMGRSE